jgi:hypothetical protein
MKIDLDDGSIDMLGSTRTTESEYAPLKYQSFKIDVDSTKTGFSSNVINSDIGFLRYEKTWKDSSGNENISNILVDEDDFAWTIEDIDYTT